jgi:Endosomal/lysosomal potassium channel TMEM175
MTAHSHRGRRDDDLPGAERMLGLSDNVVAFALTLLVLQVRVPSRVAVADPASAADLAAQLASQASHLVSYVIAFYVIAQFWLTHRRVFRHLVGHRDSLAWWNFGFPATITVMPFTSSLLGEYPANPLAVDIVQWAAERRSARRAAPGGRSPALGQRPTLPRAAQPAHRRWPGNLQPGRPPQHEDSLEAQGDGQIENDGGGPQSPGARAGHDQDVVHQVRDQGHNPQRGSQPVALGPGLAVLEPDPDGPGPQCTENGREHQAARQGGERQRVIMALAQELHGLEHADDHQDRDEPQG